RDAGPGLLALGDHLADPVGGQAEGPHVGVGEARAAVAEEAGADDVVAGQLEASLEEDPPPARAPVAVVVVKGPADVAAQGTLHVEVPWARRGEHLELAREHPGAGPAREGGQGVGGGEPRGRLHWGA